MKYLKKFETILSKQFQHFIVDKKMVSRFLNDMRENNLLMYVLDIKRHDDDYKNITIDVEIYNHKKIFNKIMKKYEVEYEDIYESSEYMKKRKNEYINKCWKNAKINDELEQSDIYNYVEILHNNEDFIDGNIGERLEEYNTYKLLEIPIDSLNIEEWNVDEYKLQKYKEMFDIEENYPPVVLSPESRDYDSDYSIIDGTHRVNVLKELGYETVKAWVGWD